jgi:lycopene cyclase domain-containing protein
LIPETKYLYLWLNIFTISVPFIRSFEPKIAFYQRFKPLGLALLITGLFFVLWDIIFTHIGIWGFNPVYLTGISLFNLPIEEYMFFIAVPYACIFIYRTLNYFIKKDLLGGIQKHITNYLIGFSGAMAIIFYDRWYTLTTFLFLALFLGYLHYVVKPTWLSRFYLAYLVCIIPFFIVNGILTGTGIEGEVVWYNNSENVGLRMGTIPLEDIFYGLLLVLMNTFLYEKFSKQAK